MAGRVYKYPVLMDDTFAIMLPKRHRVLSVQVQNGQPQIWVLVDLDGETEEVKFHLAGTGNLIAGDAPSWTYIGTFQMSGGALVFHLFQEER